MIGKIIKWLIGIVVVLAIVAVGVTYYLENRPDKTAQIGKVKDEAMLAGRDASSFTAADEDYFKDMDRGAELTPDEIKGRNTWLVWTAGNDRFWDFMANNTFGAFDLLKILSSHPSQYYSRDNRWNYLGLVNEPCFTKASGPDADNYGLWLDKRAKSDDCADDPYANAIKYPGVKLGARGNNIPLGSFYGEPSGIVGLRLFPNPDFDTDAQKNWDAEAYYSDPAYYNRSDLVRPYRVGMSCGFCHVGPSPVNPPEDPENPKWENLISNPGAQYFWVDRIFFWDNKPVAYGSDKPVENERNFIFQLFHTNPPGALDTSLVSTDNINNPRTMNAVYELAARLGPTLRWGEEKLKGGSADNDQFNNHEKTKQFSQFFDPPDTVKTARILKDGADAAGVLGALNRVYLNIGLFSEEWLLHFNPLVGGQKISPITIKSAKENSSYWNATEQQNVDVALFFLKTAQADLLKDAPGGTAQLNQDEDTLNHGKQAFATHCARCHSSKIPQAPAGIEDGECANGGNGPQYLSCWNKYWEWSKTDEFKQQMTTMVMQDDFLENNFLSTDRRIPSTLLDTNICSPLATNAIADDIWDNFSSETYKQLPAVGKVKIQHPVTGEEYEHTLAGGGRGYTRPASLVSLWSTAPFLLNNSVGYFNPSPSVEARLGVFQDSIEKMLLIKPRVTDKDVAQKLGIDASRAIDAPGYMYRTTAASCLKIPAGYLPEFLQPALEWSWLQKLLPWLVGGEGLEIGPIPKGTPINLLANLQILPETDDTKQALAHRAKLLKLVLELKSTLKEIGGGCSDADLAKEDREGNALKLFRDSGIVDDLVALSKCPDYIVNKGHYFGTDMFTEEEPLSLEDRKALVEYLKYF